MISCLFLWELIKKRENIFETILYTVKLNMKFNVFMERLQTFFYIFVTFYVLAFLNFNVNDVTDDISYLM